jgi:hypothetical protein
MEFTGIVVDAGADVADVKPGDRVVGSFVIACGRCSSCRARRFNFCERRAALGLGTLAGDLDGAQAEYVRVPHADCNLLKIPWPRARLAPEIAFLCGDVLATGFHATSPTTDGAVRAPAPMITHRLRLEDASEAYELFRSRKAIKIALTPWRSAAPPWSRGGRTNDDLTAAGENLVYFSHQSDGRKRLHEVAVATGGPALSQVRLLRSRGEHEDGYLRRRRVVLEHPTHLKAGSPRHHDVKQDQRGPVFARQMDRLIAVGGLQDFVTIAFQRHSNQASDAVFVVSDQQLSQLHLSIVSNASPT